MASPGDQALVFVADGERFAVDLRAVREVVAGLTITPLAGAGPAVLGLVNVRGEIVPVFSPTDAPAAPGPERPDTRDGADRPDPADRRSAPRFVVLVDAGHAIAGLASDDLPAVATLGNRLAPGRPTGTLGAVFHIGDATATVLDPWAYIDVAAGRSLAGAQLGVDRAP